jgi:hypothetical protein
METIYRNAFFIGPKGLDPGWDFKNTSKELPSKVLEIGSEAGKDLP